MSLWDSWLKVLESVFYWGLVLLYIISFIGSIVLFILVFDVAEWNIWLRILIGIADFVFFTFLLAMFNYRVEE